MPVRIPQEGGFFDFMICWKEDVMMWARMQKALLLTAALLLIVRGGLVESPVAHQTTRGAYGGDFSHASGVQKMDADVQAIQKQRNGWIAAINDESAERFVSFLTDDAVWLPWSQAAISGKRNIQKWLERPFAEYCYAYSVSHVQVRIAGDWAVERSKFRTEAQTLTGEKAPTHEGTYTLLWRKTDPGIWLIERYIDHTGDESEPWH